MACASTHALQTTSLAVPSSARTLTSTSAAHAVVLLAHTSMSTPVTLETFATHKEVLHGATIELDRGARDVLCYATAFDELSTRAMYVLDMCSVNLAFHPDAKPTAAASLQFLTAYAKMMPRETLLNNTRLLQRIAAAAISTTTDDDTRCLAWAAALALTRRLVEQTSCFRSRLASAGLLPLLERARELLEAAKEEPQRVVQSATARKDLVYALQLLCHVGGTGDAYYIARLHQLHMVEALRAFGMAKGFVSDVGVDEDVQLLMVKLQGAARRLRGHLLMG